MQLLQCLQIHVKPQITFNLKLGKNVPATQVITPPRGAPSLAQKLVSRGHHIDGIRLALSTLFVHELIHRFIYRGTLQVDTHDKEQGSPKLHEAGKQPVLLRVSQYFFGITRK